MVRLQIDSLIQFDDAKPAVHPLADSGHARVLLVCLKAGQSMKDHRSPSQVIAHCLQGRATFFADGVPSELSAGSIVFLEPNHFHRLQADQDSVVMVTLAPHPAREGYPREHLDTIIERARAND